MSRARRRRCWLEGRPRRSTTRRRRGDAALLSVSERRRRRRRIRERRSDRRRLGSRCRSRRLPNVLWRRRVVPLHFCFRSWRRRRNVVRRSSTGESRRTVEGSGRSGNEGLRSAVGRRGCVLRSAVGVVRLRGVRRSRGVGRRILLVRIGRRSGVGVRSSCGVRIVVASLLLSGRHRSVRIRLRRRSGRSAVRGLLYRGDRWVGLTGRVGVGGILRLGLLSLISEIRIRRRLRGGDVG